MSHRIILTGGGSAGHVTPNLAIIDQLRQHGWDILYIGSKTGIERDIVAQTGVPYLPISAGKLRRYFSWQNFIDPFKTLWGIVQSLKHCYRHRPDVVFSKGGFVAFPVVVAARCLRIPVIAHESDLTPGLANKLSYYFANKILLAFPQGQRFFKDSSRVVVTGTPVRQQLLSGNAAKGRALVGFTEQKPILLVIGGGLGARVLNELIEAHLDTLLETFQIIHLCGQHEDHDHAPRPGYYRFGYVHEPLADLFAAADLVISRAGANAIWELLALNKPHILIPLSSKASRGDQIINARYFESLGVSRVIEEEELTLESLQTQLAELQTSYAEVQQSMRSHTFSDASKRVIDILESCIAT